MSKQPSHFEDCRLSQQYDEIPRTWKWGMLAVLTMMLMLSCALVFWFWSWAFALPVEEDFTDTGVGCVDDCLEPMYHPEPLPVVEA